VLLLMVVAAVASVTQLAVLGSWGRSLRPDITVTISRNGVIKHIRHFIVK
jgi:hypothetical protein